MALPTYKRDPRDIELALATYAIEGTKVDVGVLGPGVIQEQLWEKHATQFRIKLDEPVPFDDYADAVNAGSKKMDYDEYVEQYGESYVPY